MAMIRQVIEGLEILESIFGPDAEVDADIEGLYVGPCVLGITHGNARILDELGWFVSADTGRWCLSA